MNLQSTCSEGSAGGHFFKMVNRRWVCLQCPEVRHLDGTRVDVVVSGLELPASLEGLLGA